MTTDLPQNVMRFYGNPQYAIDSIGFKEITFLHPDKLNDPFDPNFFFETDFNENYSSLYNYVQQCHLSDLQIFKSRLPEANWKRFVEQIESYFNSLRNNAFVFSTSAVDQNIHPKDNLYMWGHYGNGHRSVAIEFDTNLLKKSLWEKTIKLNGEKIDDNEIFFQIKYPVEMPNITCESIFQFIINDNENSDEEAWAATELGKIIQSRIISKSKGWEIENEWRFLMRRNDETNLKIQRLSLLDETISAIYLGCRINEDIKEDLISETKRGFPNANIFLGKRVKGAFVLEWEQLY
jgi:Protein of unknown function (DUF2971).